jgi:hypothetical protein
MSTQWLSPSSRATPGRTRANTLTRPVAAIALAVDASTLSASATACCSAGSRGWMLARW